MRNNELHANAQTAPCGTAGFFISCLTGDEDHGACEALMTPCARDDRAPDDDDDDCAVESTGRARVFSCFPH